MRIGIDISQLAYERTGVANIVQNLVQQLSQIDSKNEYILFYSSLRKKFQLSIFNFSSRHFLYAILPYPVITKIVLIPAFTPHCISVYASPII